MAPKQTPPRAQRLVKGKQWALQYEGQHIVKAYRKRFGVDRMTAINDLGAMGVLDKTKLAEMQQKESERLNVLRQQRELAGAASQGTDEVCLPNARRARENHVLLLPDEGAVTEPEDILLRDSALGVIVQILHGGGKAKLRSPDQTLNSASALCQPLRSLFNIFCKGAPSVGRI